MKITQKEFEGDMNIDTLRIMTWNLVEHRLNALTKEGVLTKGNKCWKMMGKVVRA